MADLISKIKLPNNVTYDLQDKVSTFGGTNLLENTKFLYPRTGTSSVYFIEYTVVNGGLGNPYVLKEGVTYTFSVDVTSTRQPFQVTIGAGNGTYAKDIDFGPGQTLRNGRIVLTFTPTAAQLSSGNIFAFRAPRYSSQGTSFTYAVSNPKLEIGNKPTDWTPAIKDLASYNSKTITFFQ